MFDLDCGRLLMTGWFRTIAKGVYQIVNPPMVAFLVRTLRDTFWPNGVRRTPPAPSTSDEKARTRVDASLRLFSFCQSNGPFSVKYSIYSWYCKENIGPVLGDQVIQESVDDMIGAFQSKRVNKHLVFVLLDLLLVHLAPEISLSKKNKARYNWGINHSCIFRFLQTLILS